MYDKLSTCNTYGVDKITYECNACNSNTEGQEAAILNWVQL